MDFFKEPLMMDLNNIQANCVIQTLGGYTETQEIVMGHCPYGCGRACSGCEYSCQTTASN